MPATLDVERVTTSLGTTPFTLAYVTQTGSTNDDVRARLGEPGCAGLVLVAEHQQAGHGRKGRAWIAPAGSALTFTVALPQPIPAATLWAVPLWSGIAVADGIADATGVAVQLVWPNDIFLADQKLAGLLAVARVAGDEAWVGVGIGLNVHRPDDPAAIAGIAPPPRYLSDAAPGVVREALLAAILRRLAASLAALDDPDALAHAWEHLARLAGTRYTWTRDDGRSGHGIAERLGPGGALVVRDERGTVHELDLADVRITDRTPAG